MRVYMYVYDIHDEKLPLERKSEGCRQHRYCTDCIVKYVKTQVVDHNISEITCPDTNCNVKLDASSCRSVLPKIVFEKWCHALYESVVSLDSSKGGLAYRRSYCFNRNCSELVLNEWVKSSCGSKVTKSNCPDCKNLFCFQCMVPWEEKHRCGEIVIDVDGKDDDSFMKIVKQKRWRRCPSCQYYVERIEGCKTITCRCRTVFCYDCGRSSCICNGGPWYRHHILLVDEAFVECTTRWLQEYCVYYVETDGACVFVVVLIITPQFECKQELVPETEATPSPAEKQQHVWIREEYVKEKDQVTGCILRNMKKKAVALGRVNFSAPPNDENFAVLIDEIIDGSMELCVGDGTFGDLFPSETIEWLQQYVTRAPGSGN